MRFLVPPPEKVVLSGRALPAVSPDGKKLVFGGIEPDGKIRLWVRPLSSLTAEPVPGSEAAASGFWAPDSRSGGFFAGGKLKRSDLNGSPPQILCDAAGVIRLFRHMEPRRRDLVQQRSTPRFVPSSGGWRRRPGPKRPSSILPGRKPFTPGLNFCPMVATSYTW